MSASTRPIRRAPTEHAEACKFAQWLRMRRILFLHGPNEGKRNATIARRLKAEGLQPGAPDFLCFARIESSPEIRGVAIEMKRRAPNYRGPTLTQRRWLEDLQAQGWAVHVARGADDAIAFCVNLGL